MERKTLKVLCLHGFRQNKCMFKDKLGFLRKMLKDYVEFVFIDAPHSLENHPEGAAVIEKSWWFTGPNQTYISKEPSVLDSGFEVSLKYVQYFFKLHGPFDGILGFSQGAAFAGLIASLIERKVFQADIKFVVIISGFKSLCIPHLGYYDIKVKIPSLHIVGDADNVISKERSQELMSIFEEPTLITHSGGHYVPGGSKMKGKYIAFFRSFM